VFLVREANRKPPPFPSLFFKPSRTIHDHDANVVIPKIAQNDQADYEGELVRGCHPVAIMKDYFGS
jgi:2-keto-4-pentenoate hydratase/2-oxohepta-3-ene-1,7-dioic acid hydratase in catechol pathway